MHDKYTVNDIMRLGPCYSPGKVKSLWAGSKSLSAADIARLDIPPVDVTWALTRLLPQEQVRAWAAIVVGRAVRKHCRRCGLSRLEQWARRWLSGVDRSAYSAAYSAAAYAAARSDSADSAAYAAADSAAHAAYAAYAAGHAASDSAAHAAYAAYAAAHAAYAAAHAAAARSDSADSADSAAYSAAAYASAAHAAERKQQVLDWLAILEPKEIKLEVKRG